MSASGEDALVCRGGSCIARQFANGSGVTIDAAGILHGVSVNSAPGRNLRELTATIPNRQVGVSTIRAVEAIGGSVVPSATSNNPYHCVLGGITARQAQALFTPTMANPNVP